MLGVGEARQVQGILFTRGRERGVVTPFMMSLRCESWDFMRASTLAPVLATLADTVPRMDSIPPVRLPSSFLRNSLKGLLQGPHLILRLDHGLHDLSLHLGEGRRQSGDTGRSSCAQQPGHVVREVLHSRMVWISCMRSLGWMGGLTLVPLAASSVVPSAAAALCWSALSWERGHRPTCPGGLHILRVIFSRCVVDSTLRSRRWVALDFVGHFGRCRLDFLGLFGRRRRITLGALGAGSELGRVAPSVSSACLGAVARGTSRALPALVPWNHAIASRTTVTTKRVSTTVSPCTSRSMASRRGGSAKVAREVIALQASVSNFPSVLPPPLLNLKSCKGGKCRTLHKLK